MSFFDNLAPKMVYGSYVVAGLVGVASILDMVMGIPFAGGWLLDIMYLLGSLILGYMCYEAHQDMKSS